MTAPVSVDPREGETLHSSWNALAPIAGAPADWIEEKISTSAFARKSAASIVVTFDGSAGSRLGSVVIWEDAGGAQHKFYLRCVASIGADVDTFPDLADDATRIAQAQSALRAAIDAAILL